MRKLLRANFSRLWHDRIFRSLSVLMVFFGSSMAVLSAINTRRDGTTWMMDYSLFAYVTLAPILTSVLTSLFIGGDYSGGTLRNKLIAGHRRGNIYLANLITCCCAGIVLCVAFAIPQGVLGALLGGKIGTVPEKLLMYGSLSLAMMIAFTALFTLISMLCQNKSYAVAGSVLLTFALVFLGVCVTSALNEPEYLAGYSYTENGVTVEEPEMKNPNYVSGIKRQVYDFLQDFTPGGQVLQISNISAEEPDMLALYDGIILIASTVFGLGIFRRKNFR